MDTNDNLYDIPADDKPYSNSSREYSDDIQVALDMIDPIQKEILLLMQSGYKIREIATHLYDLKRLKNNSVETVKHQLRLARS